ncbi:Cytochrome b5 reductase 4 [Papilio machaon]|uniref:Cytochrome b5 reductase 4 n=1 Tax=Papilio machaon TaxID=76193 RepID=A0A194RD55_PAPMA|nr:Cytochrome b5 reductase 4 [Papilio machaon]
MSIRKLLCCFICNRCPDSRDTSSSVSHEAKNNKNYLKSGNGLIDWIRLGNSGVDLTGVGGRVRMIHPSELKQHNTKNDAWLAIRGRVYNITQYLPFHPGGAEELMRGAGRDATELFDKIHPWINYDSLLVKCLVGTLRVETQDIFFDANDSFPESDLLLPSSITQDRIVIRNQLTNYTTPPRKKRLLPEDDFLDALNTSLELEELSLPGYLGTLKIFKREMPPEDVPPALFYDWEQTPKHLTIAVYTGPYSNPGAYSRIAEGNLLIEVTINGWLQTIKVLLEETVQEHLRTKVCYHSGKIEITAYKAESKIWKSCGEITVGSPNKITSHKILEYKVICKKVLTHDSWMLAMAPRNGSIVLPLGHHVKVHQTIAGSEYVRSYTPVNNYWDEEIVNNADIRLAVKRYDNGILSPMLTSLNIGEFVKAAGPYGTFQLHRLKSTRIMYLLAAGTGITPMLGLITFMLTRSNPKCDYVHLLFFNKTEKDIMFHDKMIALANEDKRFNVIHILSNAGETWKGRKGRISAKLLPEIFGEHKIDYDEDTSFACVCGPKEFTFISLNILKGLGVEESFIHVFIG